MQIGHPGRRKAAQGQEVGQQERGSQLMFLLVPLVLHSRKGSPYVLKVNGEQQWRCRGE